MTSPDRCFNISSVTTVKLAKDFFFVWPPLPHIFTDEDKENFFFCFFVSWVCVQIPDVASLPVSANHQKRQSSKASTESFFWDEFEYKFLTLLVYQLAPIIKSANRQKLAPIASHNFETVLTDGQVIFRVRIIIPKKKLFWQNFGKGPKFGDELVKENDVGTYLERRRRWWRRKLWRGRRRCWGGG